MIPQGLNAVKKVNNCLLCNYQTSSQTVNGNFSRGKKFIGKKLFVSFFLPGDECWEKFPKIIKRNIRDK